MLSETGDDERRRFNVVSAFPLARIVEFAMQFIGEPCEASASEQSFPDTPMERISWNNSIALS